MSISSPGLRKKVFLKGINELERFFVFPREGAQEIELGRCVLKEINELERVFAFPRQGPGN